MPIGATRTERSDEHGKERGELSGARRAERSEESGAERRERSGARRSDGAERREEWSEEGDSVLEAHRRPITADGGHSRPSSICKGVRSASNLHPATLNVLSPFLPLTCALSYTCRQARSCEGPQPCPQPSPRAEPAAEAAAKPEADTAAKPAAESAAESAAEPTAEPTAESTAEPAAEPTAEPATESASPV